MAAPVVEAVQTGTGGYGTSITITKPSGTVAGDLLVAHVAHGTDTAWNTPSGWTLISTLQSNPFNNGDSIHCYKIAGSSEPSTYTFTAAGSGWNCGAILRISGFDPTSPVNIFDTNRPNGTPTTIDAPSVTTTVDNCLVLRAMTLRNPLAVTTPGGETSRYNHTYQSGGDAARIACSSAVQATAGSTGTGTFSWDGSQKTVTAITIGIAPAPIASGNRRRRLLLCGAA